MPEERIASRIRAYVEEQEQRLVRGERRSRVFGGHGTVGKKGEPLGLVSVRSVQRWVQMFERSGRDIRSLVPGYAQRGKRGMKLSQEVEEVLKVAVERVYLRRERAPVTHVIDEVRAIIAEKNAMRVPGEAVLEMPSRMSVYRYIERLDPEEVDTARFGKWMARQKHQQVEQGPRAGRPNERWELDHTMLDVVVIDEEDGLPIGRPTLTAVRDKYSGCIPGFALSFEPPCVQSVLDCLLYAIPEKTQVQNHFGLKYGYVGYGVPETLVVDQGKEMLGRDLEEACLHLGIKLVHNPGRSPWMKGSIERWFGTLNTDMVHALPGTTFSHVLQRGDYRSEHVACVTLDGLWVLLHRWIVEVYTREYRRGSVQGVPVKLWEQATERGFVPRLPANREALAVLLSRRAVRTVHRYGIELEGLLYQDARLAKIRSQGKMGGSVHVQVKYHAGDLSRIWVLDEQEERYIEVEAVDRVYTDGLSLWKHRVIRGYVREEMKREVNQEALGEARVQLHREMREAFGSLKSLQSRKRAARWMNRRVSQLLGEGSAEEELEGKREEGQEKARKRGDKRELERGRQGTEESTEPDEDGGDMMRWYGEGLR